MTSSRNYEREREGEKTKKEEDSDLSLDATKGRIMNK